MKQIKWSKWESECGRVDYGKMAVKDILPALQKLEMKAQNVLRATGAEHVVYGVKFYKGIVLKNVQFYMWPMNDDEFNKLPAKLNNSVVYALHRR